MLYSVGQSGGHLGGGLGVVELTVVLHYSLNTPFDNFLVWDVGHQAYPHKILTGRKKSNSYNPKKVDLRPFLQFQRVNMTHLGLDTQAHL